MNKKNLIPLLILIVLVLIFVIIKMNDRTEKRIRFFDLDSLKIASIEIHTSADTLILEKIEGSWMITHPVNFPPAEQKINDFFEKVLTVETTNIPVSESDSSFETYGLVDSVGTIIRFYNSEKKLLDESIVNKSSNYNYAYARKYDDCRIYQLLTNITYNMNPAVSPWRNKEILKMETDLISRIDVAFGDTLFTLTATDTLWNYQNTNGKFPIAETNPALKGILNNVSNLRSSSFVDGEYDQYAESFIDPVLSLQITTFDGDIYQLRFAEYEDNKFLVQRNSGTEHLYVVFEYLTKIFMKSEQDFSI